MIRYEFLWSNEAEDGQEDGSKKRPCAIIVASKKEDGGTTVIVAPITHTPPNPPGSGVEIPIRVRQALGLDNAQQWVILNDLNEFIWPGYHIYPLDNTMPVKFDYGHLPPKLFDAIRDKILSLNDDKKKVTGRD